MSDSLKTPSRKPFKSVGLEYEIPKTEGPKAPPTLVQLLQLLPVLVMSVGGLGCCCMPAFAFDDPNNSHGPKFWLFLVLVMLVLPAGWIMLALSFRWRKAGQFKLMWWNWVVFVGLIGTILSMMKW